MNGRVEGIKTLAGVSGKLDTLPAEISRFIGREQDRAELRQLLVRTRLLTLTGPGGVGKTRLALRLAADVVHTYPAGACVAELATLADARLVPQSVATALGVSEQPGRALSATLADAIGKDQLLLVLDNCEHLVGAISELVGMLLRACSQLRVLATSRQPLGVEGEVVWRVPSLPVPATNSILTDELAESESVQLLVDRITAAAPGFTLDETTAPQVAAICRQLDGIPLALELAAARVPSLGLAALSERLQGRLSLLMGAGRSVPPRHQTLNATLDWSYDLLDRSEQQMLRSLAAFAGGWTLEAAEAVCATDEGGVDMVPELLGRLVDKSLVQVDRQADGTPRFRLLETVRQYAQERLEQTGELAVNNWRHAAFFQSFAARMCDESVKASMVLWLARAERDHDNFRKALAWLIQHQETERGQQLAADLRRFWGFSGYVTEGRGWYARVLALPGPPTTARALALHGKSILERDSSNYAAMRSLNEQALAIARRVGDADAEGFALTFLGMAAHLEGQLEEARARLEEVRRLLQVTGSWVFEGIATHLLGYVAHDEGDYATARALNEQALDRYIALDYPLGAAMARDLMGWICHLEGDLERSAALLEQALNAAQGVGDRRTIGQILYHLAHLALEQKDLALARTRLERCLATEEALGHRRGVAFGLEGCARLAVVTHRPELALRLVGAAAAIRAGIGSPISPSDGRLLERWLAPARATLSAQHQKTAWAKGYALPLRAALAEARTLFPEVRRRAGDGPAGLTGRELEVLQLVAAGHSNKEIADHLVLSIRTVERHVANIYLKIGAQSRSDATSFALRSSLVPLVR